MIRQKGFTLKFFLEQIGMTRQGFKPAIENNSVSVNVLLKMAQALDVPVSCFFDGAHTKAECAGCADKQKIISLLEEKYEGNVIRIAA